MTVLWIISRLCVFSSYSQHHHRTTPAAIRLSTVWCFDDANQIYYFSSSIKSEAFARVCVCVELNKFDSLRGARALPPGTITRSSWPIGVEYLHSNALVRRGRTRSYLRVRQAAREREREWRPRLNVNGWETSHTLTHGQRGKSSRQFRRDSLWERFDSKLNKQAQEHTLSSVKLAKREYRE